MRTKVTLALLFLNVALFALIFYTRHELNIERTEAEARLRVLGDEVVGLTTIEIKSPASGDILRLGRKRSTDAWEITAPINWPANDFAVKRIIHELEFLKHETSFLVKDLKKSGQSLSDYGLNPPSCTLAFTRDPALTNGVPVVTELGIGDTTKVGNRLYLLSPDKKTVHVVGRSLADSLNLGLEQLRSDALFTIPVFEVRSLGLQIPAPDGKNVRLRLRRDGARWSFEAPIVARAGKTAAEVTVSALNALRVGRFLNKTEAPLEHTGLASPALRVTLEGNNRRETLLVGLPAGTPGAETTEFYAQMEGRDQVFATAIPNELMKTLRLAQEKLRETRILDFDPALVTAVSISDPSSALTPELTLQRLETSAAWQIVLRTGEQGTRTFPADATRVGNLLQRLSLLSATHFLSDAPSQAELENFGFNLPQRKITLTLAPSGGGPVTAAPTQITLVLAISGATAGSVQARVEGQTFVYAVPADTLNELPVASRVYRDRTLSTLPEGTQITGLSFGPTDGSAPLYNHQLAPGETWAAALTTEPVARRAALETVLAQLRTLRAKQLVSDTFSETTLVNGQPQKWKYQITTTLALGGGGGQTKASTLFLSERSGGGTQLAGSPEFGVVFEIEQPLLDALWTLTYGGRDPGEPAVVHP
jgi:hypothetical protein